MRFVADDLGRGWFASLRMRAARSWSRSYSAMTRNVRCEHPPRPQSSALRCDAP